MYTNETIDKNACAYTEIYEILRIFPKELVAKIPREQIMFFYNNMDRKYQCNITKENIGKGELLEETVALLTILFRDYWATKEQRYLIIKKQQEIKDQKQKELMAKFEQNKNISEKDLKKVNVASDLDIDIDYARGTNLETYKEENIFKRIISKIREIFGF